jgi:hypothetical protein
VLPPDDPRHGKYTTYNNHGCRCSECRNAWNVYNTEKNHRLGHTRPREQYLAESSHHGWKRYRKGCRCEVCRAASAAQKRRQRARHAEHYRAYDRARRRRSS